MFTLVGLFLFTTLLVALFESVNKLRSRIRSLGHASPIQVRSSEPYLLCWFSAFGALYALCPDWGKRFVSVSVTAAKIVNRHLLVL